MSKIAIFGDTSQDISQEMAKQYEIEVLYYQVQMDNEHYKDQIEIDSKTFYEKLPQHEKLMTGTPSPSDLIERLEKVKKEGVTDIIMISSSVKLTAMHTLYATHGTNFEGMNLFLIDSETVGGAAGLLLIYASFLRKNGYSAVEITQEIENKKKNTSLYALFRTLSYLVKGGRFNKYKGMIGNLLNIKPLLFVENGIIEVKDRFRGKTKSLEALAKVVIEEVKSYKNYWIIIFSGDNQEEVNLLKEKLKDVICSASLFIETELSPVLGVHAGPNAIGIGILALE